MARASTAVDKIPESTPALNGTGADTPREVPEIKSTALSWQSEGFSWREALVRLPQGMILQDLQLPEIWKNIQHSRVTSLQKLDRVTLLAYDESWLVRDALVVDAGATSAVIVIKPSDVIQLKAKNNEWQNDEYVIRWAGTGYGVYRRKDNVEALPHKYDTVEVAKSELYRLEYPEALIGAPTQQHKEGSRIMGTEHDAGGAGTALVPASGDGGKPTFTAEDLAHIDPGNTGLADGGPELPSTLPAIEAEIAEIRALQKTNPKKYWSDPVQAREQALIARKIAPAPADANAPGPSAELLEAWDKQGGREFHLQQARSTVQAMLDNMAPEEQAGFTESFDRLPVAVTSAVYAYLAVGGGSWGSARDADIHTFTSTPEGAELVKEWGSKAARHVATVKGRLGLMRQAMGETNWKAAEAWLDELSSSQAKAVWRALVK